MGAQSEQSHVSSAKIDSKRNFRLAWRTPHVGCPYGEGLTAILAANGVSMDLAMAVEGNYIAHAFEVGSVRDLLHPDEEMELCIVPQDSVSFPSP